MTQDLERKVGDKARQTDDYSDDPNAPSVGRWYMVKSNNAENEDWLGCVIHIGSNYTELKGVQWRTRVHDDNFDKRCTPVEDAEAIINGHIQAHQTQVRELMAEVKRITLKLGVAPDRPQGETQAIAVRGQGDEIASYKLALIDAKEEQLPKLFSAIKEENKEMAKWLKAKLIPLEAESEALEPAMTLIKDRIFSVELYAGLCETVVKIKDGKPASIDEPIHLYQRRAYMDEECLARYEAGGMEFKDIDAFHKWLARKENMYRLLPQPRAIVAFRVRRNRKDREAHNLSQFWNMLNAEQADKFTYLYIRNGDQLFCLATAIAFDESLFPDMDRSKLDGKLYAKMSGDSVLDLITEGHYLDLLKEEKDKARERRLNYAKAAKKDKWKFEDHGSSFDRVKENYHLFSQDDVYYDDMAAYVKDQMDRHNRLVLVLQGLLDRSQVLHPHLPYQLWKPDDFANALRLIYDNARALTTGDKPDFERYRSNLNATIKKGTITVGQEDAWLRHEAKKENARRENDRYRDRWYELTWHRPDGDPGMGLLSRVDKAVQTIGNIKLTYSWVARSRKRRWEPCVDKPGYRRMVNYKVDRSFTCEDELVLNVDAYTPGDFKIFFDDPRTRAEYLQWAPLLLVAEDYKAGKRKLGGEPEDD